MDKTQYLEKLHQNKDWKPGREAIEHAFGTIYKDAQPIHIYSNDPSEHSFLKGFILYRSPKKYVQIIGLGLSNISADPDAFGNYRSGWGCELTVKLQSQMEADIGRYFALMNRAARFVHVKRRPLLPYSHLSFKDTPFTAEPVPDGCFGVLFVPDTAISSIDTIHGTLSFLQILPLDWQECALLERTPTLARQIAFQRAKGNKRLIVGGKGKPSY